jgi:fibronectin type 3 domain-containing protein
MNRSLSQTEYINVLGWKPNPANLRIAAYRIYVEQGGSHKIIAELPVSFTKYWHRDIDKNRVYVYAITAVDEDGSESLPSKISIDRTSRSLENKKNIYLYFHPYFFSWIHLCGRFSY